MIDSVRPLMPIVAIASLAVSCGGGGGAPASDAGDASSPVAGQARGEAIDPAIVGLWDISDVDPEFGQDVAYYEITADGGLTIHDYLGDEYDAGENCHLRYPADIISLGGDLYRLSVEGVEFEGGDPVIALTGQGDVLRAEFADTDDVDADGDTTETLVETFPRAAGLHPDDLEPCRETATP